MRFARRRVEAESESLGRIRDVELAYAFSHRETGGREDRQACAFLTLGPHGFPDHIAGSGFESNEDEFSLFVDDAFVDQDALAVKEGEFRTGRGSRDAELLRLGLHAEVCGYKCGLGRR